MITKSRILAVALALVGGSAVSAIADKDHKDHDEVTLAQVPEKVQAAIKKHVGDGKIEDIHKKTDEGKTYYKIDYENAKGVDYTLVLTEGGHMLGNRKDD